MPTGWDFMGYFDDFTLCNVTEVSMYGKNKLELIHTECHYLGLMQGDITLGNKNISAPFIYFTPQNINTPNGWHSPAGKSRKNFYLECTGKRADRLFAAFRAEKCVQRYFIKDPLPYEHKLRLLKELFKQGPSINKGKIVLVLEEFALLLEEEIFHSSDRLSEKYCMEDTVKEMGKDPGKKWDFRKEAAKSSLSLRHWNRLFVRYAGVPPYTYLRECRIRLAKELLGTTALPIKEISEKCGLQGTAEFTRFFRTNCGMTPGKFRRRKMG